MTVTNHDVITDQKEEVKNVEMASDDEDEEEEAGNTVQEWVVVIALTWF